ncbi:MAG: N-acetylmuramoyl-L-alanine amidase [Phycisphaerae bacterium]|nr:N-acetylmuramoyl-L-alanine amidase [Phycisphaerae bacterium]
MHDRRDILRLGLASGAAALLAACQRQGRWTPLSKEELEGPPTRRLAGSPGRAPASAAPSGVIPRREWTQAQPALALINPMNGVERITIHHSAIPAAHLRTKDATARMLESIRKDHTGSRTDASGRNWADIGYHFIIDPAGRVWEGRPAIYQGAHVRLNNEHNLGIMLMGNFEEETPSRDALTALDAFVASQMRRFQVPINRVFTHQEIMPTACPGRNLQRYMLATRGSRGTLARA